MIIKNTENTGIFSKVSHAISAMVFILGLGYSIVGFSSIEIDGDKAGPNDWDDTDLTVVTSYDGGGAGCDTYYSDPPPPIEDQDSWQGGQQSNTNHNEDPWRQPQAAGNPNQNVDICTWLVASKQVENPNDPGNYDTIFYTAIELNQERSGSSAYILPLYADLYSVKQDGAYNIEISTNNTQTPDYRLLEWDVAASDWVEVPFPDGAIECMESADGFFIECAINLDILLGEELCDIVIGGVISRSSGGGNTTSSQLKDIVRIRDENNDIFPYNIPNTELECVDFGDAPESFGDPLHRQDFTTYTEFGRAPLYLGAYIDTELESDGTPHSDGADADDKDDLPDDEDGVPEFKEYDREETPGEYTVSVIVSNYTEETVESVTVCGWIDFDAVNKSQTQTIEQTFEEEEKECQQVSTKGISSVDLVFTIPDDFTDSGTTNYYARFRVCSVEAECNTPIGEANDGEVEDYLIPLGTVPVTLSYFEGIQSGGNRINFTWMTSSEMFNLGFQLWGQDSLTGEWLHLHDDPIEPASSSGLEPQTYTHSLQISSDFEEVIALGISNIDSDGSENFFGPFDLDQSYGSLDEMEPIDWEAVREQADARMLEKGCRREGATSYIRIPNNTTASATYDLVEFFVTQDGLYRITAADLLAAGVDWSDEQANTLAVTHRSLPVVRKVIATGSGGGDKKKFGANGEIIFYAKKPSAYAGIYTASSIYRITLDPTAVRNIVTQDANEMTDGFASLYRDELIIEENKTFVMHTKNDDPWLASALHIYANPRGYATNFELPLDALTDSGVELTVSASRNSEFPSIDLDQDGVQNPEHIMVGAMIDAGGNLVEFDTREANGRGEWIETFQIPVGTEFPNPVLVGAIFSHSEGYSASFVGVDNLTLSYLRPYISKPGENHLSFIKRTHDELVYQVDVLESGSPFIYASDGENLSEISPNLTEVVTDQDGNFYSRVTFSAIQASADLLAGETLNYWVSNDSGFLSAESLQPKTVFNKAELIESVAGQNYLVVAHPAFMGNAADGRDYIDEFVALKENKGYDISVVDYLDVVDAYGGQFGPQALDMFLNDVEITNNIDYVLLVGGTTIDYHDVNDSGITNFIPAHYGETKLVNFTPTDAYYAQGEDGQLFAAIGRWPVRTMDDLRVIVDKTIAWINQPLLNPKAVFVAENTLDNERIDFRPSLERLRDQYVTVEPDGTELPWEIKSLYMEDYIEAGYTVANALATVRSQFITELNAEPDVVMYNGHASPKQLSYQNILKASNIASSVINSKPALWLPLSCYTVFFESTGTNTLAHQLMFAGADSGNAYGAVSIIGPKVLSNGLSNEQMARTILEESIGNGNTIGNAMGVYHTTNNNPELITNWALLGDPSLVIEVAPY